MDSTAAGPAVDVAVVVVTWNSADVVGDFLACLPASLAGLRYQVVIADNASTDGTADVVRRLVPRATVVDLGRNAGYAAGINAGLRTAEPARAVLICNPDVRLRPRAVRLLLAALDDPEVGMAVPRLVDGNGRLQPSLRRRPTVLRALGEAVLGGARAGRFDRLGEVIHIPSVYEREMDVEWATGACLLASARCLHDVGEWNESFFLYSEETDYALRAHDRGFRVRYVPDAVAEHDGGDLHRSPHLWRLRAVNRVRLYEHRHGPAATRAYWAAATLHEGVRALAGHRSSRIAYRALRAWRPRSETS
ncbi:MAG: glycosyltransferase family 2 protein [Actinobacteria bacterium]|nr:glycosyltransferase family 2 protein [Actinomycetota bacterium]